MSSRGKWAPIDLGGFRLYLVVLRFEATTTQAASSKELVSVGRSPTDAAERVKSIYTSAWRDAGCHREMTAKGYPLNVFQPESWSGDEIPEPGDPRFGKWV